MHRLSRLVPLVLSVALLLVPAGADAKQSKAPKTYRVGMAAESVALSPNGSFAGKAVYLGGYGISNGRPADTVAGVDNPVKPADNGISYDGVRPPANGNLADGIHVRATVISAGKGDKQNFAIADIENQGCFVQNKQGFGLITMRQQVEDQTNGALPADHVYIQCDHSHGGPDLIGAWGGVPTEYLKYVEKQTEDAIVAAYQAQKPATLWYGTAPSGVEGRGDKSKMDDNPLLTNQMGGDPTHANDVMDDELRVLQA